MTNNKHDNKILKFIYLAVIPTIMAIYTLQNNCYCEFSSWESLNEAAEECNYQLSQLSAQGRNSTAESNAIISGIFGDTSIFSTPTPGQESWWCNDSFTSNFRSFISHLFNFDMGDNDHDNETVWIERNVAHETSNEVLSLYQLPDREYVADETIKELLSRNGVPEIQLTSDRGHLSSLNDFRVQQVLVDYTGSVLGENFDIGLGAVFQEQADLLDERDRRDALNINNTISLLENPENNNYFSTSLIARLNEILNDPNRHCFSQSEVNSFHETKVEGGALANATRSLFTFDSPNGGAEAPSGIRIEGGAEAPSRTIIASPNGGAEAPNSNSSGGSEALKRPNSSADGGSEVSKKRKF